MKTIGALYSRACYLHALMPAVSLNIPFKNSVHQFITLSFLYLILSFSSILFILFYFFTLDFFSVQVATSLGGFNCLKRVVERFIRHIVGCRLLEFHVFN